MKTKFKNVLTKHPFPAIIIYIDSDGELHLETSAEPELCFEMVSHVAVNLPFQTPIEVSDEEINFVPRTDLH